MKEMDIAFRFVFATNHEALWRTMVDAKCVCSKGKHVDCKHLWKATTPYNVQMCLERHGPPFSNGALHEECRRRDRIRFSHGPQRIEVGDMGRQMGVMKRSTCRVWPFMEDDVAIQYIHMFLKGMDLLFRMLPYTRCADVGIIENSPVEYVYSNDTYPWTCDKL